MRDTPPKPRSFALTSFSRNRWPLWPPTMAALSCYLIGLFRVFFFFRCETFWRRVIGRREWYFCPKRCTVSQSKWYWYFNWLMCSFAFVLEMICEGTIKSKVSDFNTANGHFCFHVFITAWATCYARTSVNNSWLFKIR